MQEKKSTQGLNLPDYQKIEGDYRHIFSYHPMNVQIARAEGVYIFDEDDNRYFDASGGPFSVNLPHNHPRMKAAITDQLDKYAYTHPVLADPLRAKFCKKLSEITPGDLDHIYLVSGGSEAVETAFKIARQAQISRGHADKYKIVSVHDSYHGMTLATLGASGSPGSQKPFMPMIPKWPHIRQYSDFDRPEGVSREEWGSRHVPMRSKQRFIMRALNQLLRSWRHHTAAVLTMRWYRLQAIGKRFEKSVTATMCC